MVEEPDDGGDPRITLHVPEDDLEVMRAIASDEDYDYNVSDVIRYSMDRKFEDREDVDWEPTTEHDPVLEDLISEYSHELKEEDGVEQVDVMLEGEADLEENSFEYAMTMYTIGVEEDDEVIQELSRQYLEENFPDRSFTKYLGGDL